MFVIEQCFLSVDYSTVRLFPTKMCIKSATYLHQKSANWVLNLVLFGCFGDEVTH